MLIPILLIIAFLVIPLLGYYIVGELLWGTQAKRHQEFRRKFDEALKPIKEKRSRECEKLGIVSCSECKLREQCEAYQESERLQKKLLG